jgi:hypothetical protein
LFARFLGGHHGELITVVNGVNTGPRGPIGVRLRAVGGGRDTAAVAVARDQVGVQIAD